MNERAFGSKQPAASAAPTSPPPSDEIRAASPPQRKIYLVPLGTTWSEEDLAFTVACLRLFFPSDVEQLEQRSLPDEAFYAPRQRYRAERLLSYLETIPSPHAQIKVGLTTVDISTTKDEVEDWGILGLANLSGEVCVISRFRAQRGARSPRHTRERLAKVVLHEVGHTLGLQHCPTFGCLMEDAQGKVVTTDHEADFCDRCRGLAGAALIHKPERLPWTIEG